MRLRPSPLCRLALIAVLCGAGFGARAGSTLYKWVDANGITHYSDVPAQGAAKIQAEPAQSYHSPAVPAARPRAAPAAPGARVDYTSIAITSPVDGAVLWNADGRVGVSAALEPGLANGHHLWFVLDGARQTDSADGSMSTQLQVARGEHTVAVTVTDASDTEVASSAAVSFAVRQNSAVNAPRGPTLAPKKPRKP